MRKNVDQPSKQALSVGSVLGLLIGPTNIPVGGFSVGLGSAGGLLLSGIPGTPSPVCS